MCSLYLVVSSLYENVLNLWALFSTWYFLSQSYLFPGLCSLSYYQNISLKNINFSWLGNSLLNSLLQIRQRFFSKVFVNLIFVNIRPPVSVGWKLVEERSLCHICVWLTDFIDHNVVIYYIVKLLLVNLLLIIQWPVMASSWHNSKLSWQLHYITVN